MIYVKGAGDTKGPGPVIVRLSGDFLKLADQPWVMGHFGITEDLLIEVWDVRRCGWRSTWALRPIWVGGGPVSVFARLRELPIAQMWKEVRLASIYPCAQALEDPDAVRYGLLDGILE